MSVKRSATVSSLSSSGKFIRNICILAHVDHGKTTLADALLATNGIVSLRQAGKLRYMDNTPAEQERGITMKSSVVGLRFTRPPSSKQPESCSFLVNLVDSPGHVDFATEVSTAVRLCDAAIIVVDVVEGVCPQTRSVLRQAWNEQLTLILVLNKIDRLILELQLSCLQGYQVICRVIEQVNSVLAEMFAADIARHRDEDLQLSSKQPASDDIGAISYVISDDLSQTDDSKLYFSPDRGNVVFASAADAWGFRPSDFLSLWSEKLNVSLDELEKFLWGDYYISRSLNEGCGGRTVFKSDAHSNGRKPVFVQLVLEPLWKAYQTLIVDKHLDEVFPMAEKLNIRLDPRAVRGANCRSVLRAFLMAWLPLGQHLLETITDVCPSPLEAMSVERAVRMLYGDNVSCPQGELQPHRSVNAVKFSDAMVAADVPHSFPDHITPNSDACLAIQATNSSPDAPTIVFVAKLFWTDKIQLSTPSFLTPDAPMNTCDGPIHLIGPEATLTASGSPQSALPPLPTPINLLATMEFVALARIFSGSIYPGQRLFVLGPKFDGSKVPSYLMDSDPSDLPVGPIRINTTDNHQRFLSSEGDTNRPDQASSTNRIKSPDLESSGSSYDSTDELHSGVTYLKHAYVAVVERVIQFMGGQRDLIEVNHSVPVGNIVGLTGTDLINFLPKSGLLVSRLSLVASKEVRSHEGVILSAPSTTLSGLALWYGPPVVSVAIEPASAANPEDSQRLEQGLRLLDKSDPCAEVKISPTGEYFIRAAGEVHLQKCLEDMTNYFVPNMELHISPFVVPFRETVIESSPAPTHSLATNTSESIEKVRSRLESILLGSDDPVAIVTEPLAPITEAVCFTCGPNDTPLDLYPPTSSGCKIYIQKESMHDAFAPSIDPTNLPVGHFQLPHSKTRTRVIIRVSVHPLPEKLLQWVEMRGARKVSQLIRAFKIQAAVYDSLVAAFNTEFSQLCSSLVQTEANRPSGSSIDWCNMAPRFLALGPGQTGPNMFFSRLKTDHLPIFTAWGQQVYAYENGPPRPPPCNRPNLSLPLVSYGKALLRGFQLATERGPLCGEPMRGVLFILEEIYAEERCRFGILDLLSQQQQQQQIASNAFAELPMEPSLPPAIDALEQMVENGRFSRMHLLNWLNENKKGEMIHFEDDDWTSVLDNGELLHSLSTEPSISEADLGGLNEKQNTVQTLMNGIPYWKRLTDEAWIQDVSPGLLTSAVSRACTAAFQASPGQRLMLCMYDVELQARPDVLGRMFGVLRKRHGRVVSEDLRDGENIFTIKARLPVIESFGLAVELRSRTSGVVSLPQLRPDGWEVLDVDPIPRNPDHTLTDKSVASHDVVVPRKGRKATVDRPTAPASAAKVVTDSDEDTVDELTSHFARVRKYIRDVRIRKGLSTNEQLVLHPDKQRTLKRNK